MAEQNTGMNGLDTNHSAAKTVVCEPVRYPALPYTVRVPSCYRPRAGQV
jgi:hypothetical protein